MLDTELLSDAPELVRILTHELFHFVWRRLDNDSRRSWEELVRRQLAQPGELGWSAEWRKQALSKADARTRSRRWREYVCESFCDSAAWYFSDRRRHPEYTLPSLYRQHRRAWLTHLISERQLPL